MTDTDRLITPARRTENAGAALRAKRLDALVRFALRKAAK